MTQAEIYDRWKLLDREQRLQWIAQDFFKLNVDENTGKIIEYPEEGGMKLVNLPNWATNSLMLEVKVRLELGKRGWKVLTQSLPRSILKIVTIKNEAGEELRSPVMPEGDAVFVVALYTALAEQ